MKPSFFKTRLALCVIATALFPLRSFASDCASLKGELSVPSPASRLLASAVARAAQTRDNRALIEPGARLLLVRRFLTGEASHRGGNLWRQIGSGQVGRDFQIRVGSQTLKDFVADEAFVRLDTAHAVRLHRPVCLATERCELLPFGDALQDLVDGALECNGARKLVYEFDDGMLVMDMERVGPLPVGEALYFTRHSARPRLAALIIFQ